MGKKSMAKNFIISIIGRDLRKTVEAEQARSGEVSESQLKKEDSGNKQILNKNRTHYRIEYTKRGPKFWTLH